MPKGWKPASNNLQTNDKPTMPKGWKPASNNLQTNDKLGDSLYLSIASIDPKLRLEFSEKILQTNKDDALTWNAYGYSLAELGKIDESFMAFDKALDINPKSYLALSNKGHLYLSISQNEKALQYFGDALEIIEEILKKNPNEFAAIKTKIDILYVLERYDEALDCINNAVKLLPNNDILWEKKCLILFLLKNYENALQSAEKALEINQKNIEALRDKGNIFQELGRLEEGIKCYDLVLQLRRDDIYSIINKGVVLSNLGQYQEAVTMYDRALAIEPNDVDVLYNKGLTLYNLGQYEEAVTMYDRALAIEPNGVDVLKSNGLALDNLGQYKDAIAMYDKALAIEPNDVDVLYNKGLALDKLGQYKDAVTMYDKALAIEPSNLKALNNKGIVLSKMGQYKEAIAMYDRVLATEPSNFSALGNKGTVLDSMGQYNEAIAMYDRVLAIEPNGIDTLYNKGVALDKMGQYNEAIAMYDRVLAIEPNGIDVLYNKGIALYNLGQYQDAIAMYDRVLAIEPNDVDALKSKGLALDILNRPLAVDSTTDPNFLVSDLLTRLHEKSLHSIMSQNKQFSIVLDYVNGKISLKEGNNTLWTREIERPINSAVSDMGRVVLLHSDHPQSSSKVSNPKEFIDLGGIFIVIEKSGEQIFSYNFGSNLQGCAISPDGNLVSVSTLAPDNSVYCFDLQQKRLLWKYKNHARRKVLKLQFRGNKIDVYTGRIQNTPKKEYVLQLDGTLVPKYAKEKDAINMIKKQRPEQKVESLIMLVNSGKRRKVLEGVAQLKSFVKTKGSFSYYKRIVESLSKHIDTKDEELFDAVWYVVSEMVRIQPGVGEQIIPDIISRFKRTSRELDFLGHLGYLGGINPNWVMNELPLIKLNVTSGGGDERRNAIFAIGRIGAVDVNLVKEVIPVILEYLRNPEKVRKDLEDHATKIYHYPGGGTGIESRSFGDNFLTGECIDALGEIGKNFPEFVRDSLPLLKDLSENSLDPYIVKKAKSAVDAIEGLNSKLEELQEKEEEAHEEEKKVDSLKEHEETKKPERDYFSKSAFVRKNYDK
jgi:tetratricopeptide (TPR) repeat protein